MSSSATESDEDYTPHGFNPTLFRQQRQATLASRKQKTEDKKEIMPEELTYINLLKRAMHILQKRKKSADIKLSIDVKRESSTKTSINLRDIATVLNRDEDHLMKFLLKEMVTSGNVSADGRLTIRGSFLSQTVKDYVRKYVDAYVVCKGCESVSDTILTKEKKLLFVKCRSCASSRHVGNIK
ncbi:hypothetical protein GVAV_001038 [Gurleya vavrai]